MSKFKVGDAVVPATGDVHDLFGHWMEYWAKGGDKRPTKFYVVGFSDRFVIYNADRNAKDGPHIPERDLQLAPYTSCAAAEVDNLADEYGGGKQFKRGDKIRVIKLGAGGSYHSAKIGAEFTVIEVEDYLGETEVYTDGDWYFYPNEIEHVTAPATDLRIEAGKFYKTRDGRKVGPMKRDTLYRDGHWYWRAPNADDGEHSPHWAESGMFYVGRGEYHLDLIAEWTDEPVAAAPKFKVGDLVHYSDYMCSGTGVVVARPEESDLNDGAYVEVEAKDIGVAYFRGARAFDNHMLRLAAPTTIADIVARHSQSGTAIVAVLENGQPRPATRPFVHTSASAAETEANRLAGANPGKEFGVYTLGTVAKVEKTYEHEWQRLAAKGERVAACRELRRIAGVSLAAAVKAVDYVKEAA